MTPPVPKATRASRRPVALRRTSRHKRKQHKPHEPHPGFRSFAEASADEELGPATKLEVLEGLRKAYPHRKLVDALPMAVEAEA